MEEKIIDGVNVAGCRRRIGKNSYCRYFKRPCADNNFNCIWKQKARLEQENEELKEQFEIETLKNNDTNECIYRSNLLNKYKYDHNIFG